jgi:two-component system response regulator HydG
VHRRGWAPLVEAAREVFRPGALLGESVFVRDLRARIARVARSAEPVLLRGPSGSGKSFVARILHFSSARAGAFLEVACGAFGAAQLAVELFGTDAMAGAFQLAQGGTLHLQDVEHLPPPLQERLLQSLDQGRLDAPELVRMVCSSTTSLEAAVERGQFQAELLQRLGEETLLLPGLAERPEDIDALSRHFLARHSRFEDARFAPGAAHVLARHDWPGNVRELEGVVLAASTAASKSEIGVDDLPPPLPELHRRDRSEPEARVPARHRFDPAGMERELESVLASLGSTVSLLDAYEKVALLHALRLKGGDKLAAAKLLGVGKSTFYRKLKQHGIT